VRAAEFFGSWGWTRKRRRRKWRERKRNWRENKTINKQKLSLSSQSHRFCIIRVTTNLQKRLASDMSKMFN
jgi:hypothetical protein